MPKSTSTKPPLLNWTLPIFASFAIAYALSLANAVAFGWQLRVSQETVISALNQEPANTMALPTKTINAAFGKYAPEAPSILSLIDALDEQAPIRAYSLVNSSRLSAGLHRDDFLDLKSTVNDAYKTYSDKIRIQRQSSDKSRSDSKSEEHSAKLEQTQRELLDSARDKSRRLLKMMIEDGTSPDIERTYVLAKTLLLKSNDHLQGILP